jgi:hypothetical protein
VGNDKNEEVFSIPLSVWFDVDETFDTLGVFLARLEACVEGIIREQRERAEAEPWDEEEGSGSETYLHNLLEETLPRTLRYSTLLHVYAALDLLLAQLCNLVQKKLALPFASSELRGHGLDRHVKYLRRALAGRVENDPFGGPFGAKLSALSMVRHRIAHASGDLRDASVKYREQMKKAAVKLGFSADWRYIEVPPGAVASLVGEAREWASKTCAAIQKALP